MTLSAVMAVAGLLNTLVFGQTNATEGVWKNGFLESTYPQPIARVNGAINALLGYKMLSPGMMSGGLVAVAIEDVKEEGAQITTYGVGDKNGKWGHCSNVKGIEGFTAKEGGSRLQVKVSDKKDKVLVGFKVDDGDKSSSVALHALLAKKLAETTSSK